MLLFTTLSKAQESEISTKIETLKTKIALSEKGEKLKFMDSLSSLVRYKPALHYDTLISNTIAYALALDSLNMAVNMTADLIYYNNSIIGKPEEGLKLFKDFLAKKLNLKNNNALARLYLNGADSYFFNNKPNEAIRTYEISKSFALKAKDEHILGFVNLYTGQVYESLDNFAQASQNYKNAYTFFKKVKDTFNILSVKNSLANLYSKNAFYKEAKQERDEAIVLNKITNRNRNLLFLYLNAAEDYRRIGNIKESIRNLLQVLEIHKIIEHDAKLHPILVCKIIIAYAEDNSIYKAEKYIKEIENNLELYNNTSNKKYYLEALKNVTFAKGDYQKSLQIAKEHLNFMGKNGEQEEILIAEHFLSKVYKALGDTTNAYYHLNNYYFLKDSIYSVQKTKTLAYYQTIYETEKRDYKIKEQKESINLLNVQNKIQNQWLIFTSTGLVSFFVFILLLRSRNAAKNKQRLKEIYAQNLIASQEKERIRLARELHDGVGQKLMLLTKRIKIFKDLNLTALSESTLDELRAISRAIYPPAIESLGITVALEAMINEVDKCTAVFFTNDIENIDNLLSKESELHLYRIVQEVLSNIVKHANAKATFITVKKNKNQINVTIKDNGKGFDFVKELNKNVSLGMKTLQERSKIINSNIEIITKRTIGTVVKLVIPF